jgi:hypothetical protein
LLNYIVVVSNHVLWSGSLNFYAIDCWGWN